MASTDEFTFVNYIAETDDEATRSTFRKHVMHDLFRRPKEADNDVPSREAIAVPSIEHTRGPNDQTKPVLSVGEYATLDASLRYQHQLANGVDPEVLAVIEMQESWRQIKNTESSPIKREESSCLQEGQLTADSVMGLPINEYAISMATSQRHTTNNSSVLGSVQMATLAHHWEHNLTFLCQIPGELQTRAGEPTNEIKLHISTFKLSAVLKDLPNSKESEQRSKSLMPRSTYSRKSVLVGTYLHKFFLFRQADLFSRLSSIPTVDIVATEYGNDPRLNAQDPPVHPFQVQDHIRKQFLRRLNDISSIRPIKGGVAAHHATTDLIIKSEQTSLSIVKSHASPDVGMVVVSKFLDTDCLKIAVSKKANTAQPSQRTSAFLIVSSNKLARTEGRIIKKAALAQSKQATQSIKNKRPTLWNNPDSDSDSICDNIWSSSPASLALTDSGQDHLAKPSGLDTMWSCLNTALVPSSTQQNPMPVPSLWHPYSTIHPVPGPTTSTSHSVAYSTATSTVPITDLDGSSMAPTATPPPQFSDLSSMTRCVCQKPFDNGKMVQCNLCDMYSHVGCVVLDPSHSVYACSGCASPESISHGHPIETSSIQDAERSPVTTRSNKKHMVRSLDTHVSCWSGQQHVTTRTRQTLHRQVAEGCADSDVAASYRSCQDRQELDAADIANVSSREVQQPHRLSECAMAAKSPATTIGMAASANDSAGEVTQEYEQPISPSNFDHTPPAFDAESRTSPGSSVEDLGDLENYALDLEVSGLRSWLLARSKSESFFRHLQRQVLYRQYTSYASRENSTIPTPNSTSSSSSSFRAASSSKPSSSNKRRRDDTGDQDDQEDKKRRVARDKSESSCAPRLACFYNKYDPMTYRSNASTLKKFEICGTRGWPSMNKLYEHLGRVHSTTQYVQCLRCTSTDFRTQHDFVVHSTAPESCIPVPWDAVERLKWIDQDGRLELQAAVNRQATVKRRLGSCTEEDRWGFAYRWLFPFTTPDDTPSPYIQDPVIAIVSFILDGYETRLRQLIRQSSELDSFASQVPVIREQLLAQYGINTDESEQDRPSLFSARTIPSGAQPDGTTALSPSDAAGPLPSSLGTENQRDQVVLQPIYRSRGRRPSPVYSSASLSPRAMSSRPHSQGTTSSNQSTCTCYSHRDTSHPHTSFDTDLPIQWPSQLSMEPFAQEYGLPNLTEAIPDATRHQDQPTQTFTARQNQEGWNPEDNLAWALNQDKTENPGTKDDMSQDFMTNESFDAEFWGV